MNKYGDAQLSGHTFTMERPGSPKRRAVFPVPFKHSRCQRLFYTEVRATGAGRELPCRTCLGPLHKVGWGQHQNPGLEPCLKPPLKHQVTDLSPQIQREGLTSARYSTQNFRSSDEPLGKKVRFALELATVSAVCWCIERCHPQRAVCVVLPGKRQRKKQAQGTGNSLEETPLTN